MTKEELKVKVCELIDRPVIPEVEILAAIIECNKHSVINDFNPIFMLSCQIFGVSMEDALSTSQQREHHYARMFYAKYLKSFNVSLQSIADKLGRKAHGTIISGLKTIDNVINTEKYYKEKWDQYLKNVAQLKKNVCTKDC